MAAGADVDDLTLARALKGDDAALRAMVGELTMVIQARVARLLLRRRGSHFARHEVEDLVQEVLRSLFEADARVLRSWDRRKGLSLKNFVGLVAEREVASILRTGSRNPWREDPTVDADLESAAGTEDGPENRVASREVLEGILDEVRIRLSPLGLHMFYLLFVDGHSVEEACAQVGMTPDAVYAWRSRCSKLIREIANDLLSEPSSSKRKPLKRASAFKDDQP